MWAVAASIQPRPYLEFLILSIAFYTLNLAIYLVDTVYYIYFIYSLYYRILMTKTIKVSDQNHRRLANFVTFDRTMDDVIGLCLSAYEEKVGVKKK
jgi:hypothetical protein